ncbi:DcrB-related protein [Candidatus Poribacteria bacterium]
MGGVYRGNNFMIDQPDEWQDKTIYTLGGPIEDEIQHNIVINVEYDVEIDTVLELADRQIESLEMQLQGCRILKRGEITLNSGQEAYEAIFRWAPTDVNRFYQRQIYVLSGTTAYTLTTTFSKRTRKTRGPEVDRILMSFRPEQFSGDRG